MSAITKMKVDIVPREAPLPMPRQELGAWQGGMVRSVSSPTATVLRLSVFLLTAALAGYGTWQMFRVVGQSNATTLQIVLVALFAVTFTWISLAAVTAVFGFIAMIIGRPRVKKVSTPAPLWTRTAIVMPVYNEDTDSAFASLERMASALISRGWGTHFDVFVLSDSTSVDTVVRERNAALRLRTSLAGRMDVYYRKRPDNEGKKAGNVGDFVRRWGAAYDFMILLDADSYMSAESIVALANAMQSDPKAGLIQTVPQLIDGTTLFARLQQFASSTYGPLLAEGLALWHARDGNYWGHNAIIRIGAFAAACGLPKLEGRRPFGGHIMSHDFVEAALLRRAGYAVYMRPDIGGSFEGTPPTLAEHAARDRRWAQGNLQHSKVLWAAGLHWMSRLHLINGIMSYLVSPFWFMFLATGITLSWIAATFPRDYFPSDHALFPTWPQFDAQQAWILLGASVLVLLLPKILAWFAVLISARKRHEAGGALALTGSVIGEVLISALIAPVLMLMHTRFVAEVLLGRDSGWLAQDRLGQDAPLSAIAWQHFGHTLTGLVLSVGTFMISIQVWLWLLPIWLGLMLAIPLTYLTARRDFGRITRRAKLFLTPSEASQAEAIAGLEGDRPGRHQRQW